MKDKIVEPYINMVMKSNQINKIKVNGMSMWPLIKANDFIIVKKNQFMM